MTTLVDYKNAVETANAFRKEAKQRVAEYVKSGQSELGNKVTIGSEPNDHYVDFNMEISLNEETNTVRAIIFPWNSRRKQYRIDVPVNVINGE